MRRARIPWARSVGDVRQAVMEILATLAKQERVKRSGRTKAGLTRARAAGKALGLSRMLNGPHTAKIAALSAQGHFLRAISRELGVSDHSVCRPATR